VETVVQKLGLDPEKAKVADTADQVSWTLARGSANVLVTVVHRPEQKNVFFRVAAPVMIPDASKPREPLFKRLLEMNAGGLANAAFGLAGDKVVAVSERPTDGLDATEVEQMIRHLSAVADTFDDRLVNEFGGKRASDG
jgi:hypothetical protein